MENIRITVKILSGGTTCREVNTLPDMSFWRGKLSIPSRELLNRYNIWEKAESKLRTFEIESIADVDGVFQKPFDKATEFGYFKFITSVGSTHTAEILENGKVRIV